MAIGGRIELGRQEGRKTSPPVWSHSHRSGAVPHRSGAIPHCSGAVPHCSGIVPHRSGVAPFAHLQGPRGRFRPGTHPFTSQRAPFSGPKALHKPAQSKSASSADAALEFARRTNKALKGRDNLCRPFRALFLFYLETQGGARASLALGWLVAGPLVRSAAFPAHLPQSCGLCRPETPACQRKSPTLYLAHAALTPEEQTAILRLNLNIRPLTLRFPMKLHLLPLFVISLTFLHPLTLKAADSSPVAQELKDAGIAPSQFEALTQHIRRDMPADFKSYALLFGLYWAGSLSVLDPTRPSESERMKEVFQRSDQYLKILKAGPANTKDIYTAAANASRAFQLVTKNLAENNFSEPEMVALLGLSKKPDMREVAQNLARIMNAYFDTIGLPADARR